MAVKAKKLSRTQLNNVMKTLPSPAQEHARRCKLLATFLVEHIKGEDWFIDAGLNPASIIDAVYYHDIGKAALPTDCLYEAHCTSAEKQATYRSHVAEGVAFLEKIAGKNADDFGPRSFERYLCDAMTEHHEAPSGLGFPMGKEELSVTGKITAIVNTFDNLFFVGNADLDFDTVVRVMNDHAGRLLDLKLTRVFLHNATALGNYVEHICTKEQNKRKAHPYGLDMFYTPVVNFHEPQHVVSRYFAEAWINDTYYGLVRPDLFRTVSEKSGQIFRLERIAFEKLCAEMDRLSEITDELPEMIVRFSACQFEKKSFLPELAAIAEKFGVPAAKICIAVEDDDMSAVDLDWTDQVGRIHDLGFRFMIDEFGNAATLTRVPADVVCLKREYGHGESTRVKGVVSGIAKTVYSLQTEIIFAGVEKKAMEPEMARMHGKYACGPLYGNAISYKELRKSVKITKPTTEGGDGR